MTVITAAAATAARTVPTDAEVDVMIAAAQAAVRRAESGESMLEQAKTDIAHGRVWAARTIARLADTGRYNFKNGSPNGSLISRALNLGVNKSQWSHYFTAAEAFLAKEIAYIDETPTDAEVKLAGKGWADDAKKKAAKRRAEKEAAQAAKAEAELSGDTSTEETGVEGGGDDVALSALELVGILAKATRTAKANADLGYEYTEAETDQLAGMIAELSALIG